MNYTPEATRYDKMIYRRCGKSGLKLPAISLGLWQNFSNDDVYSNFRKTILTAFDAGITHFDLANNYGGGSAEKNFGLILNSDLKSYRDELIISTKAGYDMWPGPYGEWGSRKYLIASLDQSLRRMNVDYVDIYYSHRFDPETPLEETMGALDHAVRQGKALYAGISNYSAEKTMEAAAILKSLGTPCLIHQPKYSMLERWCEAELLNCLQVNGMGCIAFSPLAQGLLTNKYLNGIAQGSRAERAGSPLDAKQITPQLVEKLQRLNAIAESRNQSLAQMAIAWLLKDSRVTSVLVGASSAKQLTDSLQSLNNITFSNEELAKIELIIA